MQLIHRLTIGWRLVVAFAIVVSLTIASAVYGQIQLSNINALSSELTSQQIERTAMAQRWVLDVSLGSSRTLMLGSLADATLVAPLATKIVDGNAEMAAIKTKMQRSESTAEGRALLASLDAIDRRYIDEGDALVKAGKIGSSISEAVEHGRIARSFSTTTDDYLATAGKLVDYEQKRAAVDGGKIAAAVQAASVVGIVSTLICVAASAILGFILTRSIVRPIHALQTTANLIADGDLTGDCSSHGTDEVAQLTSSLAHMQGALASIVAEIRDSTASMLAATTEVASGNQDLSVRTEQTAGSLQQAASSMAELSDTVRHGADAATQAHALAVSAEEIALKGGDVVSLVVQKMLDIDASSGKISRIVGTIDSLAFQTNILALNASIEAARAGDRGRGFAVVAGEVRMLAQRCAEAAREIKALIGTSVSDVGLGTELVRDAGSTMERIVAAVRGVSTAIGEITTAANEQAAGIGLLNQTVGQVDAMTQQNAALVEQSAAAAESMRDQADRLDKVVERFRTK